MRLDTIMLPGKDAPVDALKFDSFADATKAAHSRLDVTHASGQSRSAKPKDWNGNTTWSSMMALVQNGWPEGRDRMQGFASKLDVTGQIAKPDITFDVTGTGGIDMGRFVTGEPECMIEWVETDIPVDSVQGGKIVHIVYNCAVSGGIDADIIMRRGAATMALIDALEMAGKRVDLTVTLTAHQYHIEIPVKSALFQPQTDQIAFTLVHPAMLRRFMFSLIAQCGEGGLHAAKGGGYGTPYNYPHGDIYVPSAAFGSPQWNTDTAALEWIKKTLAEQGITLETSDKR